MPDTGETLNKRVAAAGVCSRRKAVDLIKAGRVTVNGEVVTEPGRRVCPEDRVCLDGRPLKRFEHVYLVMNKPAGYVTTLEDPQRRPTVARLLPPMEAVVKPVGRLDMNTEGLLLFTNDGQLAQRLTHPSYGIEKEYEAVVEGLPSEEALERLRNGVVIEGGKTAPAKVSVKYHSKTRNETGLILILHEGRKRQVRLMCEAVGHPVKALKRVRLGPIRIKNMPRGACRLLSKVEVDKLKKLTGLQ